MSRWWFVVVIVVVVVVVGVDVCGASSSSTQQFCPDLKPQRSLDLDQLMGMWYAVEIIQHHHAPPKNSAATLMDICPVLHLARVSTDHLRLLWDEKAGLLEYNFKIPVKNSPGFWLATGQQNGSLSDGRNYVQFSGTAQVMKAVGSHMVLTLCSRQEHQVMSVLMAREMKLDKIEVISVNNMLERRGLAMSQIRETCKNGATKLGRATSWLMVVLVLLGIMATKKN